MASLKVIVSQIVLCALFGVTSTHGKPPKAIAGGFQAAENQFPYQVSLQVYGTHTCGGSIIDRMHILTAAHCVDEGIDYMTVVISSNSISYGGRSYTIKRITTHPGYYGTALKNDLAVITLNNPITLDSRTQIVRLPKSNISAGAFAVVSGWGYLFSGGTTPDRLGTAQMTVLASDQCNLPSGPISSTQFCAISGAGTGICDGDSGGPLVSNGELVGVASFITPPCGQGYPDVFTRVYSYVDWIRQVTRSS